uniref:Uncharacterized protein n=1 Tax=Glossina pallidipes TaxID=7398 RepID=A0A1A9Z247_GLOPL
NSRQTLQEIKSKFEAYVTPKVSSALIHEIVQAECETLDELIMHLRFQPKTCELGSLIDNILRNQFIVIRSSFQKNAFQTCEGTQQAQKRAAEIQNKQASIRLNICINVITLSAIDVEQIIQFMHLHCLGLLMFRYGLSAVVQQELVKFNDSHWYI